MKKQRTFWMDDEDYKLLKEKARESDTTGKQKGQLERFLELIARSPILILAKGVKVTLSTEP